jgi:hypothetical protein
MARNKEFEFVKIARLIKQEIVDIYAEDTQSIGKTLFLAASIVGMYIIGRYAAPNIKWNLFLILLLGCSLGFFVNDIYFNKKSLRFARFLYYATQMTFIIATLALLQLVGL